MSKHTPGPWLLVETPDDVMISDWHIQIGEYPIKLFPFIRQYSECRKFIGLITDSQKMADARLITAAPDLLEALVPFLDFADRELDLNGEILPDTIIEAARKAIAKARGES